MDLMEAIRARHSVRRYTDRKIEGETLDALKQELDACNREGGLHIQLCLNEPAAFSGMMARYGKFSGVTNYLALVGPQGPQLEEKCGYYGERLVLRAQQLGLNTCWVALSYSKGKSAARVAPGEKLLMVITVGYGETQGAPHKSRPIEQLYTASGPAPDWFLCGVEAARLAPTAMNQQKFRFSLSGTTVWASAGAGFYVKTDLGIAKYHFELGAGKDGWSWG